MTQPTDYRTMRTEVEQLRNDLDGFRRWLTREEVGGATVVRIDAIRRFFGWPD